MKLSCLLQDPPATMALESRRSRAHEIRAATAADERSKQCIEKQHLSSRAKGDPAKQKACNFVCQDYAEPYAV